MALRYFLVMVCFALGSCGGSSAPTVANADTPLPAFSDDQVSFLASNAARNSVNVTASGLQYEVLVESMGDKPSATSYVTVHYVGTLTNGTEFDSSHARGQPSTFQLNRTIAGWVEGLQLMTVGSIYRFVIPAELAYGSAGAGSSIGPNETLIFTVELLEINSN